MKTCDVCQKPLGVFNKFRYADGYICKECYKKASNHFAETIVKRICQRSKNYAKDTKQHRQMNSRSQERSVISF